MLFHTLDFAAFFGVVLLLYGLLRGPWLLSALTAASYFFYGYIQPYYVVVLLLLTLSDWAMASSPAGSARGGTASSSASS